MFWTTSKPSFSHLLSLSGWPLLLIATIGLSVSGIVWWLFQGQRSWLEIHKGKDGVVEGLHVSPQKIPQDILARLPSPDDNTPLRDPVRIKALAEKYGLYQAWQSNPHLRFDEGVINYWSKQARSAWELEMQFLSRQLVLEAAERAQARIPSPGDLSQWAERVYPILFKNVQQK